MKNTKNKRYEYLAGLEKPLEVPQLDAICKNCSKRYGVHSGFTSACLDDKQEIIEDSNGHLQMFQYLEED